MEQDLKPTFSPFMRRLDPLLAAEDTNPIYEAFRRRRELYGSGVSLFGKLKRLRFLFMEDYGITLLIILLQFIAPKFGWLTLPILLALLILLIIRKYTRKAAAPEAIVPPSPRILLEAGKFGFQTVLCDLYLAGMTGRDLAEAMYLESRRHPLAQILFVDALLTGFHLAILFVTNRIAPEIFTPALTVAFMAFNVWFAFEIFSVANLGAMAERIGSLHQRAKKLFSASEMPFVSDLKRATLGLTVAVTVGAVVIPLTLLILGRAHPSLHELHRLIQMFVVVYMVIIGSLLVVHKRKSAARLEEQVRLSRLLLEQTAEMFEVLIVKEAAMDEEKTAYEYSRYKEKIAAKKLMAS